MTTWTGKHHGAQKPCAIKGCKNESLPFARYCDDHFYEIQRQMHSEDFGETRRTQLPKIKGRTHRFGEA